MARAVQDGKRGSSAASRSGGGGGGASSDGSTSGGGLWALRARARAMPLLLPPANGDLGDDGLVLSSPAAPLRGGSRKEHAGHAYHDMVMRASGLREEVEVEVDDVGDAGGGSGAGKENAGKKLKRMISEVEDGDLYGLLELGGMRWRATADDIKKAFRKISLQLHPDKVAHLGEEAKANAETHYKKVLDASNILSDKKRRMAYDSTDTGSVDDSLPSEASVNDANFFKKLVPVFEINARWSVANRVPSLGDESTGIDEVNRFYDFWYAFKTWRDFSFDLEHDPDTAESREEKRWMERQNSKHVKTRKLEEAARIRKLVDMAYKKDPRIRAEKEAVRMKKEALKRDKAAKREAEAEAAAAAAAKQKEEEELKLAKEKEERAKAKKGKEAARQLLRKSRQRIRAAVRDAKLDDREDVLIALERCCAELAVPAIDAAAEKVVTAAGAASQGSDECAESVLRVLNTALAGHEAIGNAGTAAEKEQAGAPATESSSSASSSSATVSAGAAVPSSGQSIAQDEASSSKPASLEKAVEWQPEELKRLTKALSKFPPGTRDRYEKLANFVGSRDAAACLAMVNAQRAKNITPKTSAAAAAAVAPRSTKSVAESDFERFQREKKVCDVAPKETPPVGATGTPGATKAGVAGAAGPSSGQMNGTSGGAKGAPAAKKPPNVLGFSPKQQSQLEAAMKKFPASLGANRWTKIAAEVGGRDAGDCEKRFKELVSYYKAKKANGVK